ncbi:hypothetical protein LTR50_002635 [Elasticomyces elasticus]|nr:hypothetical protein LTR50_002635 [Elasticomyces elasticus]
MANGGASTFTEMPDGANAARTPSTTLQTLLALATTPHLRPPNPPVPPTQPADEDFLITMLDSTHRAPSDPAIRPSAVHNHTHPAAPPTDARLGLEMLNLLREQSGAGAGAGAGYVASPVQMGTPERSWSAGGRAGGGGGVASVSSNSREVSVTTGAPPAPQEVASDGVARRPSAPGLRRDERRESMHKVDASRDPRWQHVVADGNANVAGQAVHGARDERRGQGQGQGRGRDESIWSRRW